MADYIKREDVLEFSRIFVDQVWETGGYRNCTTIAVPVEKIEEIPSADVVEVRHGKWEVGLCYNHYLKGALESKCSICGSWNLFDFNGYNCESNFCPNCGADMRKDGE